MTGQRSRSIPWPAALKALARQHLAWHPAPQEVEGVARRADRGGVRGD